MLNILAVGAHPDDVEFACGATLAKHKSLGDNVTVIYMTDTGYKDHVNNVVKRTPEQSQEEAKAAGKILGCDLIQLNFEELHVPFNLDSVVALEKIIIELKIDTIYTHSENDCHQDHIATRKSVLAASRGVHNIFLYEQLPLPRVRKTDSPNFFVDVKDFFDIKIEACLAHKTQVEGKYGDKLIEDLTSLARYRGSQCGIEYAEAFSAIKQLF
jgi:LmbE family N-acetylglucosaminyl deacetylase